MSDAYRYTIRNLHRSSDRLGLCEICNQYTGEVFHMIEEKQFFADGRERWTHHECKDLFGHEQCLLNARKSNSITTVKPAKERE